MQSVVCTHVDSCATHLNRVTRHLAPTIVARWRPSMFESRMSRMGVALLGALWLAGCGGAASSPGGMESCQTQLCTGGAGSYKLCSAPGAASCRYVTSDMQTFACASCSNCTAAATMVASWCSTAGGSTTTGGTSGGTTSTG